MNQFQLKRTTMKRKIGGGFVDTISRKFGVDKKSRCKRKANEIISTCMIQKEPAPTGYQFSAYNNNENNIYRNILLSQSAPSDFYYVHPDQRKNIYSNEWVKEKKINAQYKYELKTKYSVAFPYQFIVLLKPYSTEDFKCDTYDPKSKLGENTILCIPCDIFGLIPSDAYLENTSNRKILGWDKFIKKDGPESITQLPADEDPVSDTDTIKFINLLSPPIKYNMHSQ